MPDAPKKLCKQAGCPKIAIGRTRHCLECGMKADQRKQAKKQTYYKMYPKKTDPFYSSVAWQKFRAQYKGMHPLCELCKNAGIIKPVYCVDHIIEIKDGGEKLSNDNAMSLCRNCHSKKTARARKQRNHSGPVSTHNYKGFEATR